MVGSSRICSPETTVESSWFCVLTSTPEPATTSTVSPAMAVTESCVSKDALAPTVTCTRCVDLAKFCASTVTS
jgi:hypothetical protein